MPNVKLTDPEHPLFDNDYPVKGNAVIEIPNEPPPRILDAIRGGKLVITDDAVQPNTMTYNGGLDARPVKASWDEAPDRQTTDTEWYEGFVKDQEDAAEAALAAYHTATPPAVVITDVTEETEETEKSETSETETETETEEKPEPAVQVEATHTADTEHPSSTARQAASKKNGGK